MRERTRLADAIAACEALERELADNIELIELAEADDDADLIADAESAIARLAVEAEKRRIETLLSGEADANDAYVEIHAGAGGTESQDWDQMLARMYMRWAE